MDNFTLPLKLTCTVSGKIVTYTSEDYVKKKLEKYGGSLERLRKEFVCRDAKLAEKEAIKKVTPTPVITSIAENGAEIRIGDDTPVQPQHREVWKVSPPVPITKETAPTDQCFNPGWYLSKKDCGACAFASICNYTKKRTTAAVRV